MPKVFNNIVETDQNQKVNNQLTEYHPKTLALLHLLHIHIV